MERNHRVLGDAQVELDRKFRVLDQSLSMHASLRDRYGRGALVLDVAMLVCSVAFCATTFASDAALSHFGLKPDQIRDLLRVFSVLAFTVSVVSLRIDWKGRSARHREAAARLAEASKLFRNFQSADGSWPDGRVEELSAVYWEAMQNSAPIPEADFVRLKARHLRKVELSRMLSRNPGCPAVVLRFVLLWRSVKGALAGGRTGSKASGGDHELQE